MTRRQVALRAFPRYALRCLPCSAVMSVACVFLGWTFWHAPVSTLVHVAGWTFLVWALASVVLYPAVVYETGRNWREEARQAHGAPVHPEWSNGSSRSGSDDQAHRQEDPLTNPATGMRMMGGIAGVDDSGARFGETNDMFRDDQH